MRRFRPLPLLCSVRLVGLVFNHVFLRIRGLEVGSSFRRYCSLSGAQRLPRFGPDRNETRARWKWSAASAVLSGGDCARRSAAARGRRRNGGAVSAASRGERPSELETILNRVCRLPGYVYGRVRLLRAEEEGDQDRSEVRLCPLAPGSVRLQPRRRRACPPSSRTPRGVNRPCCGTGLERRSPMAQFCDFQGSSTRIRRLIGSENQIVPPAPTAIPETESSALAAGFPSPENPPRPVPAIRTVSPSNPIDTIRGPAPTSRVSALSTAGAVGPSTLRTLSAAPVRGSRRTTRRFQRSAA